jgi:hypothetical protein
MKRVRISRMERSAAMELARGEATRQWLSTLSTWQLVYQRCGTGVHRKRSWYSIPYSRNEQIDNESKLDMPLLELNNCTEKGQTKDHMVLISSNSINSTLTWPGRRTSQPAVSADKLCFPFDIRYDTERFYATKPTTSSSGTCWAGHHSKHSEEEHTTWREEHWASDYFAVSTECPNLKF